MSTTKHKGRLSISRPINNMRDPGVFIYLTDDMSLTRCVEINIPIADFAELLFGRGELPCEFEFRPDRVGLKHEHKTEQVRMPKHDFEKRQSVAKKALAPFEIDGWKGSVRDMENHNNYVGPTQKDGSQMVRVQFVRWIPATEPTP